MTHCSTRSARATRVERDRSHGNQIASDLHSRSGCCSDANAVMLISLLLGGACRPENFSCRELRARIRPETPRFFAKRPFWADFSGRLENVPKSLGFAYENFGVSGKRRNRRKLLQKRRSAPELIISAGLRPETPRLSKTAVLADLFAGG